MLASLLWRTHTRMRAHTHRQAPTYMCTNVLSTYGRKLKETRPPFPVICVPFILIYPGVHIDPEVCHVTPLLSPEEKELAPLAGKFLSPDVDRQSPRPWLHPVLDYQAAHGASCPSCTNYGGTFYPYVQKALGYFPSRADLSTARRQATPPHPRGKWKNHGK